ncbi:MAG: tRNA dihydrouridine synthase DusB [Muribaculaceae bacterium]|nr:tRNA dihydrouridine synthase DusB [Muribaculaceae bacterium]MDE6131214.1 tRNA dihydrouridine synthase DusB [Muribaculaceae bacterium]
MKIANIDLGDKPVMLAPMEDVTDSSFRLICKEMGCDLTYTEFVSADALIRNIAATTRKLEINPAERPTAIQIYGREPEVMAMAARIAAEARPDFIDINFGCPVKKVAGKGAGAGLLRDVPKLLDITRAVVDAVDLPVTVKTRLGWDHDSKIIDTLALQLQDCGISALTIHGRTRSQLYSGEADWEAIARVKAQRDLEIPVIGNGDITTPEQLVNAFTQYGVDGVMVGRASIGAPWIFHDMKQTLLHGSYTPLTAGEKLNLLRRQIRESIERIDGYRGILHIRRHLAASPLFKGIPDFRPTRIAMLQADNIDSLFAILDDIEQNHFKQYCL